MAYMTGDSPTVRGLLAHLRGRAEGAGKAVGKSETEWVAVYAPEGHSLSLAV